MCVLVSKYAVQKFDMDNFNIKKLNDAEVKEQYQLKISNRFAALENLMTMTTMMRVVMISVGIWKVLEYENFSCRESGL
jgi:glycine betaine/choline ABC-type transport system substrate-binding protein